MHEASRQQVADRVEVALLYLAKFRPDGEHGVYQTDVKGRCEKLLFQLCALSWTFKIL
jgi:hypothetical protein